jgi:hypothetical protein
LERRGSDEEPSQMVVQIVHPESVNVCSDGREIGMRLGKDKGWESQKASVEEVKKGNEERRSMCGAASLYRCQAAARAIPGQA